MMDAALGAIGQRLHVTALVKDDWACGEPGILIFAPNMRRARAFCIRAVPDCIQFNPARETSFLALIDTQGNSSFRR